VVCGLGLLASCIVFRPGPRAAPWAASARRGRPPCWWARGPGQIVLLPPR